jgi:hypothetical protein
MAKLGMAKLGMAKLGMAKLGMAKLGMAKLGMAKLGSAKLELGLLVLLLSSGCVYRPAENTACQDISGIVGREYRISFFAILFGGAFESALPDITPQFRETLIMGDRLCKAAERGVISYDLYSRYLDQQLRAIGVIAVRTGANGSTAAGAVATIARDILRVARGAITLDIDPAHWADLADNRPIPELFGPMRQTYASAVSLLPPDIASDTGPLLDLARPPVTSGRGRVDLAPPVPSRVGGVRSTHILFASGSAQLDARALNILSAMLTTTGPGDGFLLRGFADARGGYAANAALSVRRIAAVVAYLKGAGVTGPIATAALGRTDSFGADIAQNRRVTIDVASPD